MKKIMESNFVLLFTDFEFCIDAPNRPKLAVLCKNDRELYIENARKETLDYASQNGVNV